MHLYVVCYNYMTDVIIKESQSQAFWSKYNNRETNSCLLAVYKIIQYNCHNIIVCGEKLNHLFYLLFSVKIIIEINSENGIYI